VHPALRGFAVELRRADAPTEELKGTRGDRRDREYASCGEAQVEREKITRGAKKRACGEAGKRGRDRVDDRLADPTPLASLVPIHAGTGDPVDRVGPSRQRLLSDCHHGCGEDEQRKHPPDAVITAGGQTNGGPECDTDG
jgi:hypothetical protein